MTCPDDDWIPACFLFVAGIIAALHIHLCALIFPQYVQHPYHCGYFVDNHMPIHSTSIPTAFDMLRLKDLSVPWCVQARRLMWQWTRARSWTAMCWCCPSSTTPHSCPFRLLHSQRWSATSQPCDPALPHRYITTSLGLQDGFGRFNAICSMHVFISKGVSKQEPITGNVH